MRRVAHNASWLVCLIWATTIWAKCWAASSRRTRSSCESNKCHWWAMDKNWHSGDDLWIQGLDKLLKRYKSTATEADRIRTKMVKKLMAKIKETIRSGGVLLLAKDVMSYRFCSNKCDASPLNVNDDLVMVLDDAMSQIDTNLRGCAGRRCTKEASWVHKNQRGAATPAIPTNQAGWS